MVKVDTPENQALAETATAASGTSVPVSGESLAVGAGIGRYTVKSVLGSGGMGVVYAAYDPDLDRKVALKLLHGRPGEGSASVDQRARLLREARAIAKISHPNVISVFEVGTVDDTDFVAMELVDGGDLAVWLAERRDWREVLRVMRRAGRGLESAHAAGLVHRDFKPANVLMGTDGRVRVTDFGLARPLDSAALERGGGTVNEDDVSVSDTLAHDGIFTRTGAILGTPAYMAPEQHRGEPSDARTDQFSFCVALYEALYGERPFVGESLAALREATLAGRVGEPPRTAQVPAWVRRVVLRGLSSDPEQRFESMGALLVELGRDPAARRKRIAGAVTVVAVIVAAIVFGVVRGRAGTASAKPCADAASRLVGVWDPQVRARVRDAFARRDRGAVFGQFSALLDRYAASWAALDAKTCRATRVAHKRSEGDLHLHTGCLLARKRELASVVEVFSTPTDEAFDHAVQAAQALTPVDSCADLDALRRGVKPPTDELTRRAAEDLRGELAQIKALQEAARFTDAVPRADKALTRARALAYQPVLAEVLYRVGRLQYFMDRPAQARQAFERVVLIADAVSYDELRARALVGMTQVSATYSSNGEATRTVARRARAAVRRYKSDLELGARLANALGMMLVAEEDFGAALSQFESAYDDYRQARGDKHLRAARPLRMIAQILLAQNEPARALEFARRALATLQLLGPSHPRVAAAHHLVASALRMNARYDEARAEDLVARRFWESPRGKAYIGALGDKPEPAGPTRSVSGTVRGPDGTPVAGAEVIASAMLAGDGKYLLGAVRPSAERQLRVARTTTGPDGTFTLAEVAEEALLIAAEHSDHGRSMAHTLSSSGAVTGLALRLRPFGRVEGRVVPWSASEQAQGVMANPRSSDGTQTRQSVGVALSKDGRFVIERLAPGKYVLQVGQGGSAGLAVQRHPMEVIGGETARPTLRPSTAGVEVEISVRDLGGMPIEAAQVLLLRKKVQAKTVKKLIRIIGALGSKGTLHLGFVAERRALLGVGGDPLARSPRPEPLDKIARFRTVVPGRWSLCVIPIGGDLKDPVFKKRLGEANAGLTVNCRRVRVKPAPAKQRIVVQVPLMKPLPASSKTP